MNFLSHVAYHLHQAGMRGGGGGGGVEATHPATGSSDRLITTSDTQSAPAQDAGVVSLVRPVLPPPASDATIAPPLSSPQRVASVAAASHPTPGLPPRSSLQPSPPPSSSVPTLFSSSSSPSPSSAIVRWGVLGCGRSAHRLLPALVGCERSSVVALCSTQPSRSAALTRTFPAISTVHSDLHQLATDPSVDVILVTTAVGSARYGSHCEVWQQLLSMLPLPQAKRKVVVMERPLARSHEEARRMVEAQARQRPQQALAAPPLPPLLLVHHPLRHLHSLLNTRRRVEAVQPLTSISYVLAAPLLLHRQGAQPAEWPSLGPYAPVVPNLNAGNGGPALPFLVDLFDLLHFVLGDEVGQVRGDAVHRVVSGSLDDAAVQGLAPLESVICASFRWGAALGTATLDLCAADVEDRLTFRGSGGCVTIAMYGGVAASAPSPLPGAASTPSAAAVATAAAPHSSSSSSPSSSPAQTAGEGMVQSLRRLRDTEGAAEGGGGGAEPSSSLSLFHSLPSSACASALESSLVSPSTALLSLACADAVLRPYYRLRTDAYWSRPHTWHHHTLIAATPPLIPTRASFTSEVPMGSPH